MPAAIVALGLSEHVITSTQGAAIVTASLISLAVCSVGAAALGPRAQEPSRPPADNLDNASAAVGSGHRRRSAYVVFRSTVSELRGCHRKACTIGCTHEFEYPHTPFRVLIVGGGVAGLEAMLALRELARRARRR